MSDETKVPKGYHVWDFYEPEEGGERGEDEEPDWMWAADESGMTRPESDQTYEQAVAACHAHRNAVKAECLRETADAFEADAKQAGLGMTFKGGPLAGASVYNVNIRTARKLRDLARALDPHTGDADT